MRGWKQTVGYCQWMVIHIHVFLRMNIVGEHQACHFAPLSLLATSFQTWQMFTLYIYHLILIKGNYGVQYKLRKWVQCKNECSQSLKRAECWCFKHWLYFNWIFNLWPILHNGFSTIWWIFNFPAFILTLHLGTGLGGGAL